MGAIRQSEQQQTSSQDIWGPQAGYLRAGYSGAADLMGTARNQGQELYGQGQQYQGQMEGLAGQMGQQYSNPYAQGLGGFNPGMTGAYANYQNPMVQQQIGQLGQNLGQFFREQLNPGITGSAVGVGGLGGGRQGVAQGMAMGDMFKQFQQGSTGIMNNAYNTGAGMAQAYDQMRLAGMGQAGQLANQAQGLNLQGYQQAGNMLGSAFGMGGNAMNAQWGPLNNYMAMIGGPQALTQSQGTNNSQAMEILQFQGGGK